MKAEAIEVQSFTKIYGKNKSSRAACKNIDFFAQSGHITGLLGLNGAGKTTLLKAICGIHYATAGSVRVCGQSDISQFRKIVGYVPETPVLDGFLTVAETLSYECALYGLSAQERKKAMRFAIAETDLSDFLGAKTNTLSKGLKKRLSLAKAVCALPRVLVLDEFSEGLDTVHIAKIRSFLKRFAKEHIVVLSTHRIDEAAQLCNMLYILNAGFIVASGTKEDLIRSSKTHTLEEAFLHFSCAEAS